MSHRLPHSSTVEPVVATDDRSERSSTGAILGPFVVVGTPLAGLLRRPLRQQPASVSVQRRAFASDRSAERDVPAPPETTARMTRPLTATGMDDCVAPQYLY